jgi:phosphatidylserine/phosphatidylglycerophosphate/cardiolipin synthase-like enzyme
MVLAICVFPVPVSPSRNVPFDTSTPQTRQPSTSRSIAHVVLSADSVPASRTRVSHVALSSTVGVQAERILPVTAGKCSVAAASVDHVTTEEFYGPKENLERADSNLLEQGTADHLDLAMYSFTDRELTQQLLRLARNGVNIRIYRDNQQYNGELRRDDSVIRLLAGNENIQVRVKDNHSLMQLKALSNGTLLREGSANWRLSGERYQDKI